MEPFNYKLCWLHSKFQVNFGTDICESSKDFSDTSKIPACHTDCSTYTQCKRAFELAGLPNNFWYPPKNMKISEEDVVAMSTTQHIRRNIASFVQGGQNAWLWSSSSGNGKTYRAVTMACTYILYNVVNKKYYDNMVKYVYIPKYIADFENIDRHSFESEKRNRFLSGLDTLSTSDLVIWDDFGYGSDSRIETTIFRAIINERINTNKSNIFISGKTPQQVYNVVGRDLGERIYNCSLSVNFTGPDLRTLTKFQ